MDNIYAGQRETGSNIKEGELFTSHISWTYPKMQFSVIAGTYISAVYS